MSKPLVEQVTESARRLLEDPKNWTQYAIARTRNNRLCEPDDAKAARFCAYGAILRAAHDVTGDSDRAQRVADRAAMLIMQRENPYSAFEELIAINDGHRPTARRAVLDLFDRALARV